MTGKEKQDTAGEIGDRVVSFRAAAARREERAASAGPNADDLRKFQTTAEADDYSHRMTMNVAGLAVVTLLILAGIWIADSLATMRKNQDCVLMGRRGCTPVDAPTAQRW
jgi:hypothetical protein